MTTYELDIVSRLYDVKVKVYRPEGNTGFKCTWEASLNTKREVKLLVTDDINWLALINRPRETVEGVGQNGTLRAGMDMGNSSLQTNNVQHMGMGKDSINSMESLIQHLFGEDRDSRSEGLSVSDSRLMTEEAGRNSERQTNNPVGKVQNKQKRLFWQAWRKKVRDKKRSRERKIKDKLLKEGAKKSNIELVFDFTTEGLEQTELDILSKGETFCVTNNKIDEDRLKTDIFNYGRRLRLHEEFRDPTVGKKDNNRWSTITTTQNTINDTQRQANRLSIITQTPLTNRHLVPSTRRLTSTQNTQRSTSNKEITQTSQRNTLGYQHNKKVRKPVSLYDPDSQNRNLNRYINCISEESILVAKNKVEFKDNIIKPQRQAIRTLKEKIDNKKIVISKADKGSGLVVVDYDTYISKGTKYIEEEAKAYEKVEDTPKRLINKLIKSRDSVVQILKNTDIIPIETATYCSKQLEEKITGMKFYFKVHKDSNILTMPLRPLQSCINAPTHHLSQVLTDILQPYLNNICIPTFIQDSNQLLFRLGSIQNLKPTDTLISADVAALYPSIPHAEGMVAVTEFLLANSTFDAEQIKNIVRALKLVIMENYVTWNNQVYKQTSGVAMGTPVAVAYANIFMHWVDEEIRERAPFIVEHFRYIDDNLFIIPEDKIGELMRIANDILRPHIRFTHETLDKTSETGLAFLDTQLFVTREGEIVSRLYTKKTDKHAYLLPSSFHPAHITKNIPQAVFNRIRRICSKEEWFLSDANKAKQWLFDREYKAKDIKAALDISTKKDRWTLIENIEKKRNTEEGAKGLEQKEVYEIPFLVTYGQGTLRIRQVLKQRQALLNASFIKTKVRPRLAFRRQQDINDILVQRALRGPIQSKEDCVFKLCDEKPKYRSFCPCRGSHDQKMCRCCAHAKLKVEGIKIRLFKNVDCNTKNIIYMVGCKDCRKRYIGETQQKLRDRLLQHLSNIGKQKQPLYTHFQSTHKASQLFITVLETVRSEEPAFRRVREAWWINKLQTLEPRGFNIKLECNQTYEADHSTIELERQEGMGRRR